MAIGVLRTNSFFSVFLKNRFPQRKIENLVAYGKPLLEALKKSDELTGINTSIPIQVDSPQGLGSTLDQANTAGTQTTGGSSYGVDFRITRSKYYALMTLDAETMMAMKNEEGAFFQARERQVEEIMEQLGQQIEMALWSTGTGSLGQLTADPGTGSTFTVDPANTIKFHIGMRLKVYADNSGALGSVRTNSPNTHTVTKINEDTGVITVSPGTVDAELIVGDHLVREGDNDALLKGVPAWIPVTAETSGTFFGADRTVAVQKLQGHRQTWLGSIEETVKKLDAKVRRVSPTKPKTLWLSYSNFNRLDLELGARGMRLEDGEQGKFGRPALMMTTPGGGVVVKAAPYVPETAGWLLDMDTWKLCTLGTAPHLVQDDGNTALRLVASTGSNGGDGIEIRWRYFAQLVCTRPYSNGVLSIS